MIYQITYKKVNGSQRKVAGLVPNREALMALRNSPENLENLAKAREGDEQAKRHLLQLAYNLGHVDGEIAGTKSIGSFFFHDVDCYDAEQSASTKHLILSKRKEIDLMALEKSASGGWHLVCRRVPGTTILENQVRVATILKLEMDTSAKDLQRVVFSTSGSDEDLPYLNDELFTEPMSAEECEAEYNRLKARVMRKQEQVPEGAKKANKHYRPWEEADPSKSPREGRLPEAENTGNAPAPSLTGGMSEGQGGSGSSLSYRNTPYSDIIKAWWQQNGGEPVEGERNVKLYQLAVNLRAICDNSPAMLMKVMPRLGLDEQELHNIVESACKEPVKGISKMLRGIIGAEAEGTQGQESLPSRGDVEGSLPLSAWGEQIAALFPHYPLLSDICKGLKPSQYPAALFVGGGLLMTLMTRCTYHFYHRPREARRLNCSTLIIGDPASGKSFATRLYDILAAPIIEGDQAGIEAVNAYRELTRSKGANKDKPKKPQVVIRNHPARTSNAQFIQDMVNSVEEVDGEKIQLHMLTFDSELDNTLRLQRGGAWIDKESMELKAFHNEVDGQAYSNTDSTLQTFKVFWNYIYTGTPIALKKKVNAQNFGSGLATRLTCIPLPATNFEMMAREEDSEEDEESERRLAEWAKRLDRMKGELPIKRIVDMLYDWTARRMADAAENDSRADEMLLKRCAYHGINFSAPFIVMRHWDAIHQEGNYYCGTFETDEVDCQLAELLTNIQYACQRHFFGMYADDYYDGKLKEQCSNSRPQQRTAVSYSNLPEEFTAEDVMRCFNLRNHSAASTRISRLVNDHMVVKIGEFTDNGTIKARYRKTSSSLY